MGAILGAADQPVTTGFLSDMPSEATRATAVALLRRLAENGLLYARLMGRELLPADLADINAEISSAKTVGDLLRLAMSDLQLAVIDGDKDALTRRKARVQPQEVLQALVG